MSELTDSTWTNYLWFDGELVGLARNGQLNFVHTDHLGRPDFATQRRNLGSGWATTILSYDGAGNLASATRPGGIVVRYEYDAARRRLSELQPRGDGTYAWTRYEYDAASNVTRTELRHTDYPASVQGGAR